MNAPYYAKAYDPYEDNMSLPGVHMHLPDLSDEARSCDLP